MECNCKNNEIPKLLDPSIDLKLLEPTLVRYGSEKGTLIPILQKAQDLYGYLPTDLLVYIAKRCDLRPSKVMGAVSFYTQFRSKPIGKHLILLCQGTACHVNGSPEIEAAIKDYLKVEEGEITEDGLFTYNNVACIGCCSLSPVFMIGDKSYGYLTKESTVEVLRKIQEEEAL
jgi:NADH-quinone oxidoreductase subunit E